MPCALLHIGYDLGEPSMDLTSLPGSRRLVGNRGQQRVAEAHAVAVHDEDVLAYGVGDARDAHGPLDRGDACLSGRGDEQRGFAPRGRELVEPVAHERAQALGNLEVGAARARRGAGDLERVEGVALRPAMELDETRAR